MADSSKKKVRIGSKVSTESVRQAEHESGTARNQAHEKESEKLQMQINEKAGPDINSSFPSPFMSCHFRFFEMTHWDRLLIL